MATPFACFWLTDLETSFFIRLELTGSLSLEAYVRSVKSFGSKLRGKAKEYLDARCQAASKVSQQPVNAVSSVQPQPALAQQQTWMLPGDSNHHTLGSPNNLTSVWHSFQTDHFSSKRCEVCRISVSCQKCLPKPCTSSCKWLSDCSI